MIFPYKTIIYYYYLNNPSISEAAQSIGICYEGGLDPHDNPADTRTVLQKASMAELLKKLHALYPEAQILGHRDFPGVKKACPCFDVKQWLQDIHFPM